MTLALCVVGCGESAHNWLDGLRGHIDDVTLFFASEHVEDARRYNDEFAGAGVFDSYEDAAADPRVEAMFFLTPHHIHRECALVAAGHGKHVLVEKPIARNLDEAREMVRAARDAGVVLAVAEPTRYMAAVDRCKELMAEGAFGDLRLVQVQDEHYSPTHDWRNDAELRGGGELVDGGIHYVDILINLGGLPETVYAVTPPRILESEGEDGVAVTVRLPGGAVGLLNVSAGTPSSKSDIWTQVTGTKGKLSFGQSETTLTLDSIDGSRAIDLGDTDDADVSTFKDFQAAITEGRAPVMSGEEGLRDLAVVVGAYESLERHTEVPLPSVEIE